MNTMGKKYHNNKEKSKREIKSGFTIIELIIVLAVFFVVIGGAVGIFISMIQQQRKVLSEQELLNQTTYIEEYMSRLIRAVAIDPTGSCLGSNGVNYPGYYYLLTHYDSALGFYQGIKFISNANVCEEFFLDTDGVLKEIKDSGMPQNILSSRFTIDHARFVINGDKNLIGASNNDLIQPRVTILLDIQNQIDGAQQEKIIQTTVSQRKLNLQ